MSRSYKKVLGWTDQQRRGKGSKWAKNQANRKVRRYKKDLVNGKAYKKLYDPWNICDWKFLVWSEQEVQELLDMGWYKHRYQLSTK